MAYYILNINYQGKSAVDYWLGERGIAPVFYGQTTIDQLRSGKDHNLKLQAYLDAKTFVHTFHETNKDAVIFSIGEEFIYIFKQKGPLAEIEKYEDDLVKGFKIEIIKKIKINLCPLVLTSIKANRKISSGTFKDLSSHLYLGNTRALEFLLTGKEVVVPNYSEYLQCLSSLEFETLVAKFLEEKGFFVPAYKGGFIKNFDLFCRNLTGHPIGLDQKKIQPHEVLSVQIKLNLKKSHLIRAVDMYFCINSDVHQSNIYDWRYFEKEIVAGSATAKWLKTTLDWVGFKTSASTEK